MTLRQRFDDGFVRDCHGDLHLGNLVRLPSGITTFDCIEFNPDLRYTDVFADVGFLTMDLTEKGHPELAAHFLNRYLERSGDY
jgi:aminoglycoside phosphotransferase family enzyme